MRKLNRIPVSPEHGVPTIQFLRPYNLRLITLIGINTHFMAKQAGTLRGIKDRLSTNSLIKNDRETALLCAKLAALDNQQRKEIARWEKEKNQVRLPSIKTSANHRGRGSRTSHSSLNAKLASPSLQRCSGHESQATVFVESTSSFASIAKSVEFPRGDELLTFDSNATGLRRSKSFQDIKLSVSTQQQPPLRLGSSNTGYPLRRSITTRAQIRSHNHVSKPQLEPGRSMPSIQVEDRSDKTDILNEKVKRFNESLQNFISKGCEHKRSRGPFEEIPTPTDDLLIPRRPELGHRWKSLPSLFQDSASNGTSVKEVPSCDDLKRCRYLRTPDTDPVSVEEIFNNNETKEN